MRLWLLITLYFSCIGIYSLLSKSDAMAWLEAGPEDGYPPHMGKLALLVGGLLVYAVPALVYANVFPAERFRWFRLDRKVAPAAVLWGVLAIVSLIFGIDLLVRWISGMATNPAVQDIEKIVNEHSNWLMQMPDIGSLLFTLLVSAVVPAVCEELFFRGAVQQVLSEWTKRPHVAIIFSTVFFTLLHSSIVELPAIFICGLVLGYAFYWTGSLRTGIIMHFVFNAVQIVDTYVGQHSPGYKTYRHPEFVGIIGFVLAGVFMFLLWKQSRKPA